MNDQMRKDFESWLNQGHSSGCNDSMRKAWQAATFAERERCALVCENLATTCDDPDVCAASIRKGTQVNESIPFVMTAIFDDGVRIVKGVL